MRNIDQCLHFQVLKVSVGLKDSFVLKQVSREQLRFFQIQLQALHLLPVSLVDLIVFLQFAKESRYLNF